MEGAKRAREDDRSWKSVPSIHSTQHFSYGNRVKKNLSALNQQSHGQEKRINTKA